jgi:NADH dehydrogenase FAD-containing subunit
LGPLVLTHCNLLLGTRRHKVSVIEAAGTILPGFAEPIKQRVLDEAAKKGVQLLLGHKILGVTQAAVQTSFGDVALGQGGLAVWTCGVRPAAFSRLFPAADDHLRAGGSKNVFLVGDAARGRGPPTAQNAKRQGEYLAHYFNASFPEKHEPYRFEELARVVDIGDKIVVGRGDTAFSLPGFTRMFLNAFLD